MNRQIGQAEMLVVGLNVLIVSDWLAGGVFNNFARDGIDNIRSVESDIAIEVTLAASKPNEGASGRAGVDRHHAGGKAQFLNRIADPKALNRHTTIAG